MENTVDKEIIEKIIYGDHNNPHGILGMHNIMYKEKNRLVVRVFIPNAKKVIILDAKNSGRKFIMKDTEYKGYFECVIPRRKKIFKYYLECESYDGTKWCMYDPYAFKPTFEQLDMHLFCEGTHYQIYEKMGANIVEINKVKGVAFCVWAPNAKRVSVIGDFNQWDGRRHAMRLLGKSGVWEIFIPGLSENDIYKYEIKTLDNIILIKTDPYGKFYELRPNNASIVYDMDKYIWDDNEWIEKRRNKVCHKSPISIYEVHIGSWRKKANKEFLTYDELAIELTKYVKEMNYTHVELMGVLEHPYDGSWGYQVTGYFAPTSRFGTPDDFRYLVDTLHQNGIGVILDWVPAHFPKDAYALEKFDGTALYEHMDSRQGEHPEWGTLIFNYGRMEVKLFLLASAIYWFDKFHIDGIRVDAVASMLYLDYGKSYGEWIPNKYGGIENLEAVAFIKHMNSVLYGRFPGIMTIAEESTSWPKVTTPVDIGGLGFGFKWNMGWMNDFLTYMKLDPIYRKFNHEKITFSFMYAFSENFIQVLSHDEVVHEKASMINKMPGDDCQKFANLRLAYGYMYTHPGKKLLFMGSEFAQYREWSEKQSLDWHLLEVDAHIQIQTYIKDLNKLYINEPALWELDGQEQGFEWIDCHNENDSLIVFYRKGDLWERHVVVVCNFTPVVHKGYRIGVEEEGEYVEVFNSDNTKYGGSGVLNNLLESQEIKWHNRPRSIVIDVPPLGVSIIKWNKNE